MKKYWKDIFIGIIVTFLLVPLGIAALVNFRFIYTDTNNEWIGFWGGYLGAIIGIIASVKIMFYTLKQEKIKRIKDEKREFYKQLIDDILEVTVNFKKLLVGISYENNGDDIVIKTGDKNSFLENCIHLNKALDNCDYHLLLGIQSDYYIDIEKLERSFDKYKNAIDEIINKLTDSNIKADEKLGYHIQWVNLNWHTQNVRNQLREFLKHNVEQDVF